MEEPVLEDVFLYSIFRARKAKLQRLQKRYQLGDSCELAPIADALLHSKAIALGDADRSRLMRKLMEVEIKALEDLTAGSEASFDCIVDRQSAVEDPPVAAMAPAAGQLMSQLVDKYLEDTAREREWPSKTVLRKRGELREFLEIAGDKPINAYRKVDGVNFKDVQLSLPIYRQKSPFKGLTLVAASTKSSELRAGGDHVDLLNPITINDKIGTVSLFFEWAKTRDSSVANPVADLRIQRSKSKRKGKKRQPWTIDELNRMFTARSTRAVGRSGTGRNGARSCCATLQSTGCRSLPCSRGCGWAKSSSCRSLTSIALMVSTTSMSPLSPGRKTPDGIMARRASGSKRRQQVSGTNQPVPTRHP